MTSMISRERILEAAERVYANHGFRGATTRLIAQEAGVNEVTLFRIFGSKAALLDEVARGLNRPGVAPGLPESPADPQRELTAWAADTLAGLRARRSLMRKTMGELEERPDVASCISHGPTMANAALRAYVKRLHRAKLADPSIDPATPLAMFMAALFTDAVGREAMPDIFPPESRAAEEYSRCLLRALGVRAAGNRSPRGRASGAPRTRTRT